jgi:FixJ family two-component response regulator
MDEVVAREVLMGRARSPALPDLAGVRPRLLPVFVVDDDASVRDALTLLLKLEGYAPTCFADGESFLAAVHGADPACIILDLHLPGLPPLAVLKQLAAWRAAAPVLVISGQPDIGVAVAAIKHGARDYLEKPFSAAVLVARVRDAVAAWQQARSGDGLAEFAGRDRLTRRECEVLAEIVGGASNKEAARRLHISPRTIEVHRARIMGKLGARNTADLMRIVLAAPQAAAGGDCRVAGL